MEKLDTEIRQEQLAQAALALIATQGLQGLSVASVARKIGLVPSAMYRHFTGKDQLVDAVIELIRERLHGNVAVVIEQTPDALERLQRLVMAHVRLIRENHGILRVLFSDDLHKGRADRKARVYEIVNGYIKRVAAIVSEGQREGRIRRDLDARTVATMFLGLIQPAAILSHLSNGDFDVTRHVEKAWPILSDAIKAN
jgi:AcrR family transcriptional regulator